MACAKTCAAHGHARPIRPSGCSRKILINLFNLFRTATVAECLLLANAQSGGRLRFAALDLHSLPRWRVVANPDAKEPLSCRWKISLRAVNETQTNPRSAKPFKNSNFPVERQEIRWILAGVPPRRPRFRISPGGRRGFYTKDVRRGSDRARQDGAFPAHPGPNCCTLFRISAVCRWGIYAPLFLVSAARRVCLPIQFGSSSAAYLTTFLASDGNLYVFETTPAFFPISPPRGKPKIVSKARVSARSAWSAVTGLS